MTSVVYLREAPFRALPRLGAHDGVAFASDEASVLHAHLTAPPGRPAGVALPCRFVAVRTSELDDVAARTREALAHGDGPVASPRLAIVAATTPLTILARAYLASDGIVTSCEVRLVPSGVELTARAAGLLSVGALASRSVGVVGVGSGGSTLAVELAKAGVGGLVLVDCDRLELVNVARHVCGVSDLGRYKTRAVRDAVHEKNPDARVTTLEIDVNESLEETARALAGVDLILGATDEPRSRFNLNRLALDRGVPAIFGRAITRAAGGDVLRVRPGRGPCLTCVFASGRMRSEDDEVSTVAQAQRQSPDYVSPREIAKAAQPGLAADIAPIANMMVRLALVELSRGTDAAICSLEADLEADLYVWANRRESVYGAWKPMGFTANVPSILRWYGARVARDPQCFDCGRAGSAPELVLESLPVG